MLAVIENRLNANSNNITELTSIVKELVYIVKEQKQKIDVLERDNDFLLEEYEKNVLVIKKES